MGNSHCFEQFAICLEGLEGRTEGLVIVSAGYLPAPSDLHSGIRWPSTAVRQQKRHVLPGE